MLPRLTTISRSVRRVPPRRTAGRSSSRGEGHRRVSHGLSARCGQRPPRRRTACGDLASGVVEQLDPDHTRLVRRVATKARRRDGSTPSGPPASRDRARRGLRRGFRGLPVVDGDRRLHARREPRVRLTALRVLLTKSRMAISAAVGTTAINRKKSARRRPKLTLRQRILGPRLAWMRPASQHMSHPRGAIAQLGERLDRTQEVAGSSPASSTARHGQADLLVEPIAGAERTKGGSTGPRRTRRYTPSSRTRGPRSACTSTAA